MDKSDDDVLTVACENFLIACDYEAGTNGREKDPEKAAHYMLLAAEGGHGLAIYNLAALYLYGRGVPQDFEMARQWIIKSKAQGSTLAEDALVFIDKKQQESLASGSLKSIGAPTVKADTEPSASFGLLLPVLFILALSVLGYIAVSHTGDGSMSVRSIFAWVFGIVVFGLILNIAWGSTLAEMKRNISQLTQSLVLTFIGVGLLASIGFCTDGHPTDSQSGGAISDQARSR